MGLDCWGRKLEVLNFSEEFTLALKGVKDLWPLFIVWAREEDGVLETEWALLRDEALELLVSQVALVLLELLHCSGNDLGGA